jgi:hypothetical protein
MHTLFDFISSVNGIEYALAILFMFGFVIFGEILKPKPFEGLVKAVAEDISFIKAQQKGKVSQSLRSVALAPLYGVLYLVAVPVLFIHGIAVLVSKVIVATTALGWSPMQAYFTSRKRGKKAPAHRTSD